MQAYLDSATARNFAERVNRVLNAELYEEDKINYLLYTYDKNKNLLDVLKPIKRFMFLVKKLRITIDKYNQFLSLVDSYPSHSLDRDLQLTRSDNETTVESDIVFTDEELQALFNLQEQLHGEQQSNNPIPQLATSTESKEDEETKNAAFVNEQLEAILSPEEIDSFLIRNPLAQDSSATQPVLSLSPVHSMWTPPNPIQKTLREVENRTEQTQTDAFNPSKRFKSDNV